MNPAISEASLSGVFRLIIIILCIWSFFALFRRIILPRLIQKYLSDFQKQFSNQNRPQPKPNFEKRDGEVSIQFPENQYPEKKNMDAEYIDYEEIK